MEKVDAHEWKPMADWSGLPDVYVTKAECQQGMFWKIEACSVPMAIGPDVRLIRADRVAQQLADAEARGMERAAAYHDAEIAALEKQIEENNEYLRRRHGDAGSYAHASEANDHCRTNITAHRISAAAIRAESALTAMARLGQQWEHAENVGTHENHVGTHGK